MNKKCIHDIPVSSISDDWDKNVSESEDAITPLCTIIFSDMLDEFEDMYLSIRSFYE